LLFHLVLLNLVRANNTKNQNGNLPHCTLIINLDKSHCGKRHEHGTNPARGYITLEGSSQWGLVNRVIRTRSPFGDDFLLAKIYKDLARATKQARMEPSQAGRKILSENSQEPEQRGMIYK
jgi:hypothetical protein